MNYLIRNTCSWISIYSLVAYKVRSQCCQVPIYEFVRWAELEKMRKIGEKFFALSTSDNNNYFHAVLPPHSLPKNEISLSRVHRYTYVCLSIFMIRFSHIFFKRVNFSHLEGEFCINIFSGNAKSNLARFSVIFSKFIEFRRKIPHVHFAAQRRKFLVTNLRPSAVWCTFHVGTYRQTKYTSIWKLSLRKKFSPIAIAIRLGNFAGYRFENVRKVIRFNNLASRARIVINGFPVQKYIFGLESELFDLIMFDMCLLFFYSVLFVLCCYR